MHELCSCAEPSAEASDMETPERLHAMKSILSNYIPSLLMSLSVFHDFKLFYLVAITLWKLLYIVISLEKFQATTAFEVAKDFYKLP